MAGKKSGLLKVSLTANFLLEEIKDRYAEKWYHNVGENLSFFFRANFLNWESCIGLMNYLNVNGVSASCLVLTSKAYKEQNLQLELLLGLLQSVFADYSVWNTVIMLWTNAFSTDIAR